MDESQGTEVKAQAPTQKPAYTKWIIIGALVLVALYGVQTLFSPERMVERALETASNGEFDVDIARDGSVEYTSEDGESVQFSAGESVTLPAAWPTNVPVPSDATISYAASIEDNPGMMSHMVSYTSTQSSTELTDLYTNAFSSGGWTIDQTVTTGDSVLLSATHEDGSTAAVQVIGSGEEIMVTVTAEVVK